MGHAYFFLIPSNSSDLRKKMCEGGVTSMEPFLRKFFPKVYRQMKEDSSISNYCKFDSQRLTAFTSSLYVAGLIATFFASSITRAFGRKPSILAGGAAFLAGAALGGAAVSVYMLILGRVLLGIGVGFANQVEYSGHEQYNHFTILPFTATYNFIFAFHPQDLLASQFTTIGSILHYNVFNLSMQKITPINFLSLPV